MSQSQLKSCVSSIVNLVTDLCPDDFDKLDYDLLYDLDQHDEGVFFDICDHVEKIVDVDLSPFRELRSSKDLLPEFLFSHTRLGNLVNKFHYVLYLSINQIKNDPQSTQIATHLEVIEILLDFLINHSKSLIKIEQIDGLILSSFYSTACLVHLTHPEQRPDLKVASVCNKILVLFETKLSTFDENSFRSIFFKILKFVIYLIEHIKDPKCIVTLWKLFSKLVFKFKVLMPSCDRQMITIQKIFKILLNDQQTNLKFIKTSLKQQNDNSSSGINPSQILSATSQSISSQLRLRNNVVQDTIKVIKLSSFLFKICRTFFRLHLSDLIGDSFEKIRMPLLSILIQINSIFFDEIITTDNEEASRRFQIIKQEFLKEYASNYESLLQHVFDDQRLVSSFIVFEPEVQDIFHFEHVLFFLVYINRSTGLDFESCMERLFYNLIQVQDNLYNPIFCTYSKKFFQDAQLDFSRLTNINEQDSCRVEFYDLIVVMTEKFILQSGLDQAKIYYLLSSIVSNEPIRSQICHDLISLFMRNYAATSNNINLLHLIKFVSIVYESTDIMMLQRVLSEVLSDFLPEQVAIDLEIFYSQNKLYRCMILQKKSVSNLIGSLLGNSVGRAIDLVDGLEKILNTSENDMLSLRKCLLFIQANKMCQLVDLTTVILKRFIDEQMKIGTNDFGEKLAIKLMNFLKNDKIHVLLANSDSQKPFFQLLLRLLNAFATGIVASPCNNEEICLFLFDFYIKNCSQKSRNQVLKFEAIDFLRMLGKRQQTLSSQQHQLKAIDLFQQILIEPTSAHIKHFALECLNEFSNSDDPNKNRVFCQLNRMGGLNQLILTDLIEISLDPNFDLTKHLTDRVVMTTVTSTSQSNSQDKVCLNLDETMNALMSATAMDTTISGERIVGNKDDDNEEAFQEKISILENDLKEIIEYYESGEMPIWLRTQLKSLAQYITKNV